MLGGRHGAVAPRSAAAASADAAVADAGAVLAADAAPGSAIIVFGKAVPETSPTNGHLQEKRFFQDPWQRAIGHGTMWPRVRSSGGGASLRTRSSWITISYVL